MDLTLDKTNYKELIISERKPNYINEDLYDKVKQFVFSCPEASMIACREFGEQEKKHHIHIFIKRDALSYKLTTWRSQIQGLFGKSNTTWDWKLRNVKKTSTVEQMLRYILKGGDLIAITDKPEVKEIFEQYKGTYIKHTVNSNKSLIQELKEDIQRCSTCISMKDPYCKRDCVEAVIRYYNKNNKVYDMYRMKNLATTLYYQEYQDDLIDNLCSMIN